jgi:uncharacterized membrane protein
MILLILGWHLTLIGLFAIILGFILNSLLWFFVVGFAALALGLTASICLRKTCSTYRSDTPGEPNAPLDYD